VWARQPQVKAVYDEDMRLAAEAITALPDGSEVYVSFAEPEAYQATLDFFVQKARFVRPPAVPRTYRLRWHNRDCLMLPSQRESSPYITEHLVQYLLPPTGRTYLSTLQAAFPAGRIVGPATGIAGQPLFIAFKVPAGTPVSPPTMSYEIGPVLLRESSPYDKEADKDSLALIGWDLPDVAAARPGDVLDLTLYWRVAQPLQGNYTITGQLLGQQLNPQGNPVWGQRDAMPCRGSLPTTAWEPGNVVVTRHPVSIAGEAPPGDYRLAVGMYHATTGQRLPMFDPTGQAIPDNMAVLTQIPVRP
jgi:hypothetical protein